MHARVFVTKYTIILSAGQTALKLAKPLSKNQFGGGSNLYAQSYHKTNVIRAYDCLRFSGTGHYTLRYMKNIAVVLRMI